MPAATAPVSIIFCRASAPLAPSATPTPLISDQYAVDAAVQRCRGLHRCCTESKEGVVRRCVMGEREGGKETGVQFEPLLLRQHEHVVSHRLLVSASSDRIVFQNT